MAKRTAKSDTHRERRAAEEARSHSGLVVLKGGPAAEHWYWRDEQEAQPPSSWRRAGYVETGGLAQNLNLTVNGVNLRWYGPGVAWRFDPSLVPPVTVTEIKQPRCLTDPKFCACGERLLLVVEGRTTCERCRIGTTGPVVVWTREGARKMDEWPGLPPMSEAEEVAETAPEPAVVLPVQPQPPTLSAEEVGSWVWQQVAHLYDR